MKKKLLTVALIVFLFTISPLITEVFSYEFCLVCEYGQCWAVERNGFMVCTEAGPLSMCFAYGGECIYDI